MLNIDFDALQWPNWSRIKRLSTSPSFLMCNFVHQMKRKYFSVIKNLKVYLDYILLENFLRCILKEWLFYLKFNIGVTFWATCCPVLILSSSETAEWKLLTHFLLYNLNTSGGPPISLYYLNDFLTVLYGVQILYPWGVCCLIIFGSAWSQLPVWKNLIMVWYKWRYPGYCLHSLVYFCI